MSRTIDTTATSAAQLFQAFVQNESKELTRRTNVVLRRTTADLPDEIREDVEEGTSLFADLQGVQSDVITQIIADRLSANRRKTTELLSLEDLERVVNGVMDVGANRRGAKAEDIKLAIDLKVRPAARRSIKGLGRLLDLIDTDHYRAVWQVQLAVLRVSLEANRLPMAALEDASVRAAIFRSVVNRDAWDEHVASSMRIIKQMTGVEEYELLAEIQGTPVDPQALAKHQADAEPFITQIVDTAVAYYEERTAQIWADQPAA